MGFLSVKYYSIIKSRESDLLSMKHCVETSDFHSVIHGDGFHFSRKYFLEIIFLKKFS